jgi:hypothetical protein
LIIPLRTTIDKKTKITTTSIALIAVVAVVVVGFSSYNIVSAYGVIAHQLRFCFTTTNTVGATGACAQSMGWCKQTEDLYASQGYSIAEPCHKV